MDEGSNQYNIFRFNLLTSLLAILNKNDESDTDFIIAKYFLNNLEKIKNTSIYDIADECFVSRSSLQRFIKNIGYDSFTQIKNNIEEVINHEDAFIDYTDHSDYADTIATKIDEMMKDIINSTNHDSYKKLLKYFNNYKNVVILTAEDSSHACKLFQQQSLALNKLIRVVTSANHNIDYLDTLTLDDLLLVCSVTGNFALAINDQLKDNKAKKCLITLNKTTLFENTYSLIHYIGDNMDISTRNIARSKNVYTSYGLTFFFDLFYHDCYTFNSK